MIDIRCVTKAINQLSLTTTCEAWVYTFESKSEYLTLAEQVAVVLDFFMWWDLD